MAKRLSDADILAQLPAARARSTRDRQRGLRANAVQYDPARKHLVLELTNGHWLGIPVDSLPELRKATAKDLGEVMLSPGGGALHFETIDADYSVPGLVLAAIGRQAGAHEFARIGGSARSAAKAKAARANGAKGGRPRAKTKVTGGR